VHSIRVNKQWRLVFRWDGGRGETSDIDLDDHSYRWKGGIAMSMTKRKPTTVGEMLIEERGGSGNSDSRDKWSFCLRAA
jgi:hypothetical protein